MSDKIVYKLFVATCSFEKKHLNENAKYPHILIMGTNLKVSYLKA